LRGLDLSASEHCPVALFWSWWWAFAFHDRCQIHNCHLSRRILVRGGRI
jgi:hypothetical protein